MAQVLKVNTNTEPFTELPPVCAQLFEAKAAKGLTFDQIAQGVGRDEVWVAALFYGQAKMNAQEIEALSQVLGISKDTLALELGEAWIPHRGLGPMPPRDPVLYRLYEGVMVYGNAIKAIIHEKFGDGIMSMIDCKVSIERKPDPKGDRVLLTFDGKFLPYLKW